MESSSSSFMSSVCVPRQGPATATQPKCRNTQTCNSIKLRNIDDNQQIQRSAAKPWTLRICICVFLWICIFCVFVQLCVVLLCLGPVWGHKHHNNAIATTTATSMAAPSEEVSARLIITTVGAGRRGPPHLLGL